MLSYYCLNIRVKAKAFWQYLFRSQTISGSHQGLNNQIQFFGRYRKYGLWQRQVLPLFEGEKSKHVLEYFSFRYFGTFPRVLRTFFKITLNTFCGYDMRRLDGQFDLFVMKVPFPTESVAQTLVFCYIHYMKVQDRIGLMNVHPSPQFLHLLG